MIPTLAAALLLPVAALALPTSHTLIQRGDPEACSKIAGQDLSEPRDVVSCLRSFPFNETIRTNSLDVVESVINFYTYETEALNAPAPFQESTENIRSELQRIRQQHYDTDYDFNVDLYFVINRLNDGHTLWLPSCYVDAYQNLLPIPIISLAEEATGEECIYVVPDANEFFADFMDGEFADWYGQKGINITRYAGAKITQIEGVNPYEYVSKIATEYTGNYLDHGIRMNSVYSSYRLTRGAWGQRLGDFAGPIVPTYPKYEITVQLTPTDTNQSETVTFPYVSSYLGLNFTDASSYWEANCIATEATNGVDYKLSLDIPNNATNMSGSAPISRLSQADRYPKANLPDLNARKTAINLPQPYIPTTQNATGSNDVLYFSMLPDTQKKTGVLTIGSFSSNYTEFPGLAKAGFDFFRDQGAEYLIIDVTNNGGGYVCLGLYLHRLLAGPSVDKNPGFESVLRDNDLARQIMASNIELQKSYNYSEVQPNYWPPSWAKIDEPVPFGPYDNFQEPPQVLTINGVQDPFGQRTADSCTPWIAEPYDYQPFDFSKIAIVGNGNCASTCAAFTGLMYELHKVPVVNFGSAKDTFYGMAGAEVLEWDALDSEVKTANLKDSPLAGPDLITNANMRHNWRASYSYLEPNEFNAYHENKATHVFAYTPETYNNPQALWTFTANKLFGI